MGADKGPPGPEGRFSPSRLVRRAWQRLTAGRRALPDFIILGAARAGTTSLYANLIRHPQVGRAARREVQYFSVHHDKGPAWYRSWFPTAAALDARSRRLGKPVLTGEASPYYLFHPLAAVRMHALVPDVKLIALLRDPVARAYSHYQFNVRRGKEHLSFEEALEREAERTGGALEDHASAAHRDHSYAARGLYLDQLQAYAALFPASRILVLRSEDLFADAARVYQEVLAFLGVDPWDPGELRPRNAGNYARDAIPGEAKLRARFRPHNENLYAWLGRDLGW